MCVVLCKMSLCNCVDFQHGNASATVTLQLDGKLVSVYCQCNYLVINLVPQIQLIPSLVFQRFGSNITLTCVPSNKTIPVFWMRNGKVIGDALFRPNGSLRHILIIINAQSSNVGNYSCGLNMTGLPTNSQSGEVILFNGNLIFTVITCCILAHDFAYTIHRH